MFTNDFVGAAKRLTDLDIPKIGARIGVGEDELHAFMDVETSGGGFDSYNRPKALYEPHIAYRNSSGEIRDKLVRSGLAYPHWGEQPYPRDSYPRIKKAMEIDETVAFLATSWGLGQILGVNYYLVGFDSPQNMVLAFMESEANQLDAMVEYMIATDIADDLRAHRWSVVARVYNGPGYADNQYDVRLEKAFNKWSLIPDTVWDAEVAEIENKGTLDIAPTIRRGDRGEAVKKLQELLFALGSKKLIADGIFGSRTEGAVKLFQGRMRLVMDGIVGPKTWSALAATATV